MGDGSFGFCCGELETLVRYNIPVTSIVFSNAVYGWIKAGQEWGFGKRYYNVDFSRTDSCGRGGTGIRREKLDGRGSCPIDPGAAMRRSPMTARP